MKVFASVFSYVFSYICYGLNMLFALAISLIGRHMAYFVNFFTYLLHSTILHV